MSKKNINPQNEVPNVTIADVAKAAGVSVPTVSRILNNKEYVADKTRQRGTNQAHTLPKRADFMPTLQALFYIRLNCLP